MVLEPMVRLLAAQMRESLRSAEQSLQPTLLAAE
jgi:hypothetical protein